MRLTDAQIEALWDNFICPQCGSGDGLMQQSDDTLQCNLEDHSLCWKGSKRDLVEAALKRAGIEVAEPWRSDEPPEGVFIAVYVRRTNMVSVVQIVNYRLLNNSFGTLGTDWKWRLIGPNPFD